MIEKGPIDEELSAILRQAAIDHEPCADFDKRVLNQVKLNFHARTLKFWAPAIFGALLAAVGLLATFEAIYFAPVSKPINFKGQEARSKVKEPLIPETLDFTTR